MFKNLKNLEEHYFNVSKKLQDPKILKDRLSYKKLSKEASKLEKILSAYKKSNQIEEEIKEGKSLIEGEKDKELIEIAKGEILNLEKEKKLTDQKIQLLLLPEDPQDEKNVILEIRSGAGGDEASLFVEELFRSYSLFFSSQNWKVKILNFSKGKVGGAKEIIASVSGKKVFSLLKYESGVHRVQRVPQTESQGRVHTSTVTVVALPEAEPIEVKVDPKDIRVDVYRSSGHGGQSVNTTDSAVRVTHLPTQTIVTCQEGKSQHSNKEQALKVLYARLLELEKTKARQEASSSRLSKIGTGDRSEKIRTYNFPQSRLTDHRLGLTLYRLEDILNGQLELIIKPLITHFQTEALKNSTILKALEEENK